MLRSRLAKPVTLQTHTKLTPVPVSSKLISYKQLIQTAKQFWTPRVPKSIVQEPQRLPASPCTPASLFEPFKSFAQLHTPLQAYHKNGYSHQYVITISNCKLPNECCSQYEGFHDQITNFSYSLILSNNTNL